MSDSLIPSAAAPANAPAAPPEPVVNVLGRRIVAIIIDTVLILLLEGLVNRPFLPVHLHIQNRAHLHGTLAVGLAHPSTTFLAAAGFLITTVLYFAIFEAVFAATPGKLLSSLRVADTAGGRPPWTALVLRNVVRPIDAFLFYAVGGIAVFLSPRRQRLGDHVARTVVAGAWSLDWVDRSRPASYQRAGIVSVALLLVILIASIITFLKPPSISPALTEKFYPIDIHVWKEKIPGAQRMLGVSVGGPDRNGGVATYPLRFTLAIKGSSAPQACAGALTFRWTGPLDGWDYGLLTLRCTGKGSVSP